MSRFWTSSAHAISFLSYSVPAAQATKATATNSDEIGVENDKPTPPKIRPPPGLQFPVYSVESFDRFVEPSDDTYGSTSTANDENAETEDEVLGEDDATPNDGSGSTVSDNEHDEAFLSREAVATEAAESRTPSSHEERQDFPSDRLDHWPIVRLPPAARPKKATRRRFANDAPCPPSVQTARDYFEDCGNSPGEVIFRKAPISFALEHQARLARHQKASMAELRKQVRNEDEEDKDACEEWLASRARAQAILSGALTPGSPSIPLASTLPLSPSSSPPSSSSDHTRLSPRDPPSAYNPILTPSIFVNPDFANDLDLPIRTFTFDYPP